LVLLFWYFPDILVFSEGEGKVELREMQFQDMTVARQQFENSWKHSENSLVI
jgi:hypothetical protein